MWYPVTWHVPVLRSVDSYPENQTPKKRMLHCSVLLGILPMLWKMKIWSNVHVTRSLKNLPVIMGVNVSCWMDIKAVLRMAVVCIMNPQNYVHLSILNRSGHFFLPICCLMHSCVKREMTSNIGRKNCNLSLLSRMDRCCYLSFILFLKH